MENFNFVKNGHAVTVTESPLGYLLHCPACDWRTRRFNAVTANRAALAHIAHRAPEGSP